MEPSAEPLHISVAASGYTNVCMCVEGLGINCVWISHHVKCRRCSYSVRYTAVWIGTKLVPQINASDASIVAFFKNKPLVCVSDATTKEFNSSISEHNH